MMSDLLKVMPAETKDIAELYQLQLLAFESEAEMIGSRDVPALMESEDSNRADFANWIVLKMVNTDDKIVGAIRYKKMDDRIDVGRLMIHPDYRHRRLAQRLMDAVDEACPDMRKELYTCTKSWINIRLYEKMGYVATKEVTEDTGLSFVYMEKR